MKSSHLEQKKVESKIQALLEGRVLARVFADEAKTAIAGHACCHDLTNKGDVSDIDHDYQY